MEEKFTFFVNYVINGRNSPEKHSKGLKNTYNVMVSNGLPMDPTRIVHLDPTRGLADLATYCYA